MSLLILNNIVKEYGNQVVLDGVSLRVERGERLALVGPNGAGKTTLLKIALGMEYPDAGSVTTARGIKVGYISQNLQDIKSGIDEDETALFYEKAYSMECQLRELEKKISDKNAASDPALLERLMEQYSKLLHRYEAIDGYTIETKVKKVLLGLGLRHESLSTPIHKLSGGEKMRVSVARVLLEEPDLLILDEPTNHLDINATEWFERFLKKFNGGILFVSHDRYFLDRVATRVAELDQGTITVRSGNYSRFVEHKKQLRQYILREQKRLEINIRNANEIVQGLKTQRKIKAIESRQKQIDRMKQELKEGLKSVRQEQHLHKTDGPKIRFKKQGHISKDIAWAENLHKSFGELTLFNGADFHIYGGERVGIIGPNGSGKTTLINMLLGNDPDFQGELKLGSWVNYSYMGQEVLFENDNLTVVQLIRLKRDMQEGEAREYLARFQFYGDEVNKLIAVLSGGERVRLYLACVMLEDADCLILDEPTNHLDMAARDAFEQALQEFHGTIIAVTHDRYFLTNCVNKILEIDGGKINTYSGNYEVYRELKFGSEEEEEEEVSQARKKEYEAEKARRNQETKARARKQQRERERKDLEARIMELEEKLREMEASFHEDTPMEVYHEYGELRGEIDGLYFRWEELVT